MPSHDTIGRVLQLVDPTYLYDANKLESVFIQTNDSTINKIINIDGKTMRGNASKDQKQIIFFPLGQKQMEYALGK